MNWQRHFAWWPVKVYDEHDGHYIGRKIGFLERRAVYGHDYVWNLPTHTWVYRLIPDYE